MADLTVLAGKLTAKVSDTVYPYTTAQYNDEITDACSNLGYTVVELPATLEGLVIKTAQVNMYYTLAGKHAQNPRIRIEGDMDIHSQQIAESYLKSALALGETVDKERERLTDSIEVLEATRWRPSDNRLVPKSDGGTY